MIAAADNILKPAALASQMAGSSKMAWGRINNMSVLRGNPLSTSALKTPKANPLKAAELSVLS